MTDPRGEIAGVAEVLRELAWTIQRRIPEAAGFHPLPTSELAALKHILDVPGCTVSDLGRSLGLRQSNASAAVRALVERGVVAREASPRDRRVTHLVPTDLALEEHVQITTAWSGAIRDALGQLDPDDASRVHAAADALRNLDGALRTSMGAVPPTGPR